MSLHNEDGIAPDSGTQGPKSYQENPQEPHVQDENGPETDEATDTDAESEHVR